MASRSISPFTMAQPFGAFQKMQLWQANPPGFALFRDAGTYAAPSAPLPFSHGPTFAAMARKARAMRFWRAEIAIRADYRTAALAAMLAARFPPRMTRSRPERIPSLPDFSASSTPPCR